MVKIRRPNARGSGSKVVAYGKYAVVGGILVLAVNLLMGGTGDQGYTNNGRLGHEILHLQKEPNNAEPPRDLKDRKTPPKFHDHHADRKQRQEEEEANLAADNMDAQGRLSGEDDSKDGDEAQEDTKEGQKIQYVSPNGEVLEKPEGTGPTKLGYVLDLVYERSHPTFRTESIQRIETSRQNHAQQVATTLSLENVQPCEYLEDTSSTGATPRVLQQEACRNGVQQTLVVYNSAPFERSWCGVSIPPHSAARMDPQQQQQQHCSDPVRLLEQDFPPVNGQGMSPIVVHSRADGKVDAAQLQDVAECSIPCRVEQGMTGIARYIQTTDWSIFQSDQDPNSKREIQVELSKYKHDEYFSTAYFKSDVPLSRFDVSKHSLRNRPPVKFEDTIDKGVYIVNDNCGATNSRRTRWLETLEQQYHVDSLGKCKHTKDLEAGQSLETLEDRLQVMKQYKFNLGFEVSTHKDWVTELSFEAFLSGAVPIILGASNAGRHFPKEGAIYTSDFNNWDKLAAHVNAVATNKDLWESYHTWRTDEAKLAAFERKYQFTKVHPDCRLCSWAYAKMYGLGWDHELQVVQETHVPRKICVDQDSGLIASPFEEVWGFGSSSTVGPTGGANACQAQSTIGETKVEQDDWSIGRSVVQHDSITDITIHEINAGSDNKVTLSFAWPNVNNTEAAYFRNSHTMVETERGMLMSSATIQDHKSKITVLANWETNLWSPKQGELRVVVQAKNAPSLHADETRRIRIISEDMGQLHDKMTEYFPSSFSKRMIKDFVDPLEVFYVDS